VPLFVSRVMRQAAAVFPPLSLTVTSAHRYQKASVELGVSFNAVTIMFKKQIIIILQFIGFVFKNLPISVKCCPTLLQ